MAHSRPFRFGVQLHRADSAEDWRAQARTAEDLGFSTVFMPDHFGDQLAPVPALVAVADATTELRVGTLVLDNDYKHPVVLAKELATIDLLSEGRLEVGLGAGWMLSDYEQAGLAYDEPRVRVDRMEEGLRVLKGAFAEGPFDFAGEHYTVTGYDGQPKPVQRPHPPILIGGGRRRLLSIAAREADIVGINPSIPNGQVDAASVQTGTRARTDEKVAWVREAAGARFDDLELNMLVFFAAITDDRAGLVEKLAPGFGLPPAEVDGYPHAWVGSVGEITDELEAHRERWGVSYWVVQEGAMHDVAPVVAALRGR
ncbi:MAG: TIGR03621 family F420-dependent LLM class oxidoreductase [Actinobacteria bacterium]|nr:TIGR03621 family F420-dependent LLM class oxidoreductase [Actinomycetota bacterium]